MKSAENNECSSKGICLAQYPWLVCYNPKYASDFYCSHQRGTNFGVNQALFWLVESEGFWQDPQVVDRVRPTLVGLENLRAAKAAFQMMKLGDRHIEDYFWNTAARLYGL